ncbi:MAG: FixH family protein [Rhizobiales bacterium]|nr:FixH family protein [Hyphomicrobiales bacterium]NRB15294.1 FixH family protein [Hyphomicrobiales bacterium]
MSHSDVKPTKGKKPFKLTGWHFLAIMLGFFAVIIAVNIVFVTSALNAFSGLVVKNSYVASQFYNAKIRQAETQKKLGWQLDLLVNKQGIDFILVTKDNQPVANKLVTLSLRSTNNDNNDIAVVLNELKPGHYFANLPNDVATPNGSYLIELDIVQNNQLFYHYEESRFIKFNP